MRNRLKRVRRGFPEHTHRWSLAGQQPILFLGRGILRNENRPQFPHLLCRFVRQADVRGERVVHRDRHVVFGPVAEPVEAAAGEQGAVVRHVERRVVVRRAAWEHVEEHVVRPVPPTAARQKLCVNRSSARTHAHTYARTHTHTQIMRVVRVN